MLSQTFWNPCNRRRRWYPTIRPTRARRLRSRHANSSHDHQTERTKKKERRETELADTSILIPTFASLTFRVRRNAPTVRESGRRQIGNEMSVEF